MQMREENARKAKQLQSLKVAKATDSSSIEQWKHEAAQLDEQNKRLQRSLASKESLLRDTKARLDVHEEGHVQWSESTTRATTSGSGAIHPPEPNTGGPDGVANLPVAELRNRYLHIRNCQMQLNV